MGWRRAFRGRRARALPLSCSGSTLDSLLALAGSTAARKQRVYVRGCGRLLFLLVWNTKWPHYILILTAPLCLAAAEGAQRLFVGPLRALLARHSGS